MFLTTMMLLIGLHAAQSAADTDPIVVTGERLTRDAANRYVNEISRPVDGQLPTFRNPVCPQVIGLPSEQATAISARVRKVARHVDVPVAPANCQANLRIIVVENSREFVRQLRDQKPEFFVGVGSDGLERILSEEGPALAWYSVQVQNEDGHTFTSSASGQSPLDRMPGVRIKGDPTDTPAAKPRGGDGALAIRTRSASIVKSTTQQAILDSYVVIDNAAVNGKTPLQVADYVTMRALGGVRPPSKDLVVDTILTLFFDGREAPPSVRAPDVAYLQALYSASPNLRSVQQINRLSKAVLESGSE